MARALILLTALLTAAQSAAAQRPARPDIVDLNGSRTSLLGEALRVQASGSGQQLVGTLVAVRADTLVLADSTGRRTRVYHDGGTQLELRTIGDRRRQMGTIGVLAGALAGGAIGRARRVTPVEAEECDTPDDAGGEFSALGVALAAGICQLASEGLANARTRAKRRGNELTGTLVGGLVGGFTGYLIGKKMPRKIWQPIDRATLDISPTVDGRVGLTLEIRR